MTNSLILNFNSQSDLAYFIQDLHNTTYYLREDNPDFPTPKTIELSCLKGTNYDRPLPWNTCFAIGSRLNGFASYGEEHYLETGLIEHLASLGPNPQVED